MRNISFAITTKQFKNRSKTVTRRLGWKNLKVGELLQGVEKSQGLKKGEKIVKLGVIRVKGVCREELFNIDLPRYGESEVIKEGFPKMKPSEFVEMFCKANKCEPSVEITRIEFEYVD